RLFGEFFGPDAPLPPSTGLPRREITAALERYLLTDDPWEDAEGESPDTPLPVRAAGIYERLRAAGWLRQERIGAREMVSMTTVVARLLATLLEFSERGPAFLGAKVRSIELQLQQVGDGQGGGDTLDEAADQARQLHSHVPARGVQTRDRMTELSQAESAAELARQLFERHVVELCVGDCVAVHRADHALAERTAILAVARPLAESPLLYRLLEWYRGPATHD